MKRTVVFLVVIPALTVALSQCIMAPQWWPEKERKTEDRMFALQQGIGNGLAAGEITPNEAQNLLAKLQNIRGEYTLLRERRTTQEEWEPLLAKLDALESEVSRIHSYPSRTDDYRNRGPYYRSPE